MQRPRTHASAAYWQAHFDDLKDHREGDRGKIQLLRQSVHEAISEKWKLKKQLSRQETAVVQAITSTEKRLEQAFKTRAERALYSKGVYTREARNLTRLLVQSGCAERHIGKVLQAVGGTFGAKVTRIMARPTARCIVTEGLIASEMQGGYEMASTKSMFLIGVYEHISSMEFLADLTFSSDGTSHKKVDFNSLTAAMRVPDYASDKPLDDQDPGSIALRSLGIVTLTSHHSDVQVAGVKSRVSTIAATYTDSPLAARELLKGRSFETDDFAEKMTGANSDHCDWRLGEQARRAMPVPELQLLFVTAKLHRVAQFGGPIAWQSMTEDEQYDFDMEIMDALTMQLGGEAYAALPDAKKDEMDRFLWAGGSLRV